MPPTTATTRSATVQQAITSLLAVQEPQFLGIGNRMFLSFATILLVWQGIRMMLAWRQSGEHMFSFAKLLLFIAFGYAMIAYYDIADPRHRPLVLQPHHGPGGLSGRASSAPARFRTRSRA